MQPERRERTRHLASAGGAGNEVSKHGPEAAPHPLAWEVSLWGRRVRCHELDHHIYLDDRFLDLTPIEFCLFWLLLRQALQASGFGQPADSLDGYASVGCYLQQVGIVPTALLLGAITSDPRSLISSWPNTSGSSRSSAEVCRTYSGRSSLASHLDRLRSKLRCHGLDVGTILLFGRSAQGYMLCPQDDGFYREE